MNYAQQIWTNGRYKGEIMMRYCAMMACAAVTGLAGCGGSGTPVALSPPLVEGVERLDDGTYVVTQDSIGTTLPATTERLSGQIVWRNIDGVRATSFAGTDVLAFGGFINGNDISAITGTQTAAPTGNATFTGKVNYQTPTLQASSDLRLNYAADTGAVTNIGGLVTVAATTTDAALSGTVTFLGATATLTGGFYGTNEIAGSFADEGLAGVIFGTQD